MFKDRGVRFLKSLDVGDPGKSRDSFFLNVEGRRKDCADRTAELLLHRDHSRSDVEGRRRNIRDHLLEIVASRGVDALGKVEGA